MQMRELASAFEAIAATTGRHEKRDTLARVFAQSTPEETEQIAYLTLGTLAPPYRQPEFLLSERMLPIAIARATGRSVDEVVARYREVGDLGTVAGALLPDRASDVTVGEVYAALWRIATLSGPEVQQHKLDALADLLRRLTPLSAQYVVRIVQGRLRLGVSDATILDALSVATIGTAALRNAIERAYNLCSDIGAVARAVRERGPAALREFKPTPGRPILSALAERLPSAAAILKKLGPVFAEPKYDGLRLQIHRDGDRVWLFSRRLEDLTQSFPTIAEAARRQIRAHRAILDGEVIVYDPNTGEFAPFQITARRRRKYLVEEVGAEHPVRVFVFDVLLADEQDLLSRPLRERRACLGRILQWAPDDPIQLTPYLETDDPRALERFFEESIARGLEGILTKDPDSPYHAGERKFNWVKLKRASRAELRDTVDVVVVGYFKGRGKRARFGIGSILGAVFDPEQVRFRTLSRVGSGLTDEEWPRLREALDRFATPCRPADVDSEIEPDVWVEPVVVVEVEAEEISRSPRHTCGKVGDEPGYALRFPRIVRLRPDKRAQDATTEDEILRLYRLQQRAATAA